MRTQLSIATAADMNDNKGKESISMRGDTLRLLREKVGLSRCELASAIGVSEKTIYRYEHGALPSTEVLIVLSQTFAVSIDSLVITSLSSEAEFILSLDDDLYDEFVRSAIQRPERDKGYHFIQRDNGYETCRDIDDLDIARKHARDHLLPLIVIDKTNTSNIGNFLESDVLIQS